jgi:hypothetical protein
MMEQFTQGSGTQTIVKPLLVVGDSEEVTKSSIGLKELPNS